VRFHGIEGRPIRVRFRPALRASRGRLLSGAGCGRPVHAGSFIRKREIVLESELRSAPQEMARIFVHELFHFAWVRLGNPRRRSFEGLLRGELAARARGELGWSAQERKFALNRAKEGPAWRSYICESFCDTAAFLYSGYEQHEEFTLRPGWRRKRALWFDESVGSRPLSI
jgi:hypothetical protein